MESSSRLTVRTAITPLPNFRWLPGLNYFAACPCNEFRAVAGGSMALVNDADRTFVAAFQ